MAKVKPKLTMVIINPVIMIFFLRRKRGRLSIREFKKKIPAFLSKGLELAHRVHLKNLGMIDVGLRTVQIHGDPISEDDSRRKAHAEAPGSRILEIITPLHGAVINLGGGIVKVTLLGPIAMGGRPGRRLGINILG